MSKIALEGNSLGSGTFTIAAPNSNSNPTLTLPTSSGTVVVTGGAQTIEFAAGSAASPSITFTGDTNTGIFSPGADTIAFSEGGTESMRIDSSGNVGIGTSSPAHKLQVAGAIAVTGTLGSIGVSSLVLENDSANTRARFIVAGPTASTYSNTIFASTYSDGSGYTERMRIDSSGNVGIGTSSPAGRLDVRSTYVSDTTVQVRFGDNTGGFLDFGGTAGANKWINASDGSTTAYPLAFQTGGTERARITSGGYFKASNDGTYTGSTANYHEIRQSANSTGIEIRATNASYTNSVAYTAADRNTTNNTFYGFGYYNYGAAAYKFIVADSGNVTNTNGSYGTISDIKHKQDIVDAGSQWDDIKNLRFRKYRLKSEVELDPNAKPFLGLVAQEAELVSPGLIEEHKDTKQEKKTREVEKTREIPAVLDEEGNEVEPARTETYTETEEYTETVDLGTTTKSIKTSILYMKAVKALQEAMTRIEALEAEVAALKGQ